MVRSNGFRFWWASERANLLGYSSEVSFEKSVQKAMAVCMTLNIDLSENIVQVITQEEGKKVKDYKLSRFACYLVAMNGDTKKPEVARAQAYFATMADAMTNYLEHCNGVERVQIRGEVSERERSLSSAAHQAGVQNFAFFQNAGYRGLYNMDLTRLRAIKGVPKDRSPLDFMNREELAANLFRITQTESKIRNDAISGQIPLQNAALKVGQEVRAAIKKIGAPMPETLLPAEDIKTVKKTIKGAHKEFKKIDGGKKKSK